ncbi:hypothetical protein ACJ72_05623 [Emergomyces africanus]|uniref:Extracellular membrane protein CFEM domain-containing protein n=1 Tax=Emergomyces africanus TaxID=1955775 RepID=A0A1B7NTJ2_9EURO|nr:hypothetical protein ACJ72_05623 [Emergomyces africanus]
MHSIISISALFTLFFVIVANINVAAAQDKPKDGNTSNCAAQYILDACVKSTTSILASCPVQDWDCLCTQYNNVLTCYNNCPGDPGRFAVESSKVANCNAAKHFGKARSSTTLRNPLERKLQERPLLAMVAGHHRLLPAPGRGIQPRRQNPQTQQLRRWLLVVLKWELEGLFGCWLWRFGI